jgi:hypothetical protein
MLCSLFSRPDVVEDDPPSYAATFREKEKSTSAKEAARKRVEALRMAMQDAKVDW